MPPLVYDLATQRLQQLADSTDWITLGAKSVAETASRVYESCPPPQPTLIGVAAANYLQAIIRLTQADILEQHNSYGAVRWFWYLRRAPDSLFQGSYGTTLGYDRLLAEVLSSQFTKSDVSERADRVTFRIDDAAFRHLARYVGRVKLLSQLHTLYRRVGKGAALDARHHILKANTSASIERAIRVYDKRNDRFHKFVGSGLGLATIEANFQQLIDESLADEAVAFLSMACASSFPAPVTYPDGAGGSILATVLVRHLIEKLRLAQILSPFGVDGGIPDYLPGIAGLTQLLMLFPVICVRVPWALSSIVQQGYVFIGEEQLRDIVESHLPEVVETLAPLTPGFDWPADFTQWFESLQAVSASVWPLSSGNVLRRFRDKFLIDTTGASHALLHRLELARSPFTGNLRGETFELQCQDLIDSTPWKPPNVWKVLRGRPLRQGGRVLTDIDAIGVKERSLLVVSCKSIIYDREYDQGVYGVIRNAQATIDSAVEKWEGVVENLRREPRGENFDFSQFDEIIGVVCTPFPVYSSQERTLEFVKPNLRVSSSILELMDWLSGNSNSQG